MRHRLLLACLVLQGFAASADEATSRGAEIEIRPRWRTGERFELLVEKGRTDSIRPSPVSQAKLRATIEVLAQDAERTILSWTWSEIKLEAACGARIDVDNLAELVTDLPIELILNADLSVTGIRNWEEVQGRMQRAVDLLLGQTEQVLPADARARMRTFLSSRANVESSVFREIVGYLFPLGWRLPLDEPYTYAEPVAFAGASIPTQVTLALTSAGPGPEAFRLQYARTFDSVGTTKAVGALFGQMIGPASSMPADIRGELRDDAEYAIDGGSMMITKAHWKRTIRMADQRRVDTIRWTLKPTAQTPSSQPANAAQAPPA